MTMNGLRTRAWHLAFRVRFGIRRIAAVARRVMARFDVSLRAALFFLIAFGLATFINAGMDVSRVNAGTLINVLVAMGTMFGGVLAIVFALSSFMQQNAADLYSSQFYEVYARDWREKVIFSAIAALTVVSFALAIFHDTAIVPLRPSVLVYVILIVTAAVFSLVDWQYKLVTKKINPLVALVFLERQCLKSLDSAHKLAENLASWLRISNENLTEEQALAVSYNRFVIPHLTNVDHQLDHLTEISLRLPSQTFETVDGVSITVGGVVDYTVTDIVAAITQTHSCMKTVQVHTLAAIHEVCCRMTREQLKDEQRRGTLKTKLKNQAQGPLKEFGVQIESCRLTDLTKTRAYRLIQSTQQDTE